MKMLTLATMLWMAMPGCADPSPDADDQTARAEASESLTDGALTTATTTWHLELSHENCFDAFERKCTSTFPSPQCPSGTVNGSLCHVASGTVCYQTIPTGGGFNSYRCL